jgi:hypothetical protein
MGLCPQARRRMLHVAALRLLVLDWSAQLVPAE